MTGFALGNHLVSLFMAKYTGEFGVFRLRAGQGVSDLLVTSCAELGTHIRSIGDSSRLMGRVTDEAVLVHHFGSMCFMALETRRHLLVLFMTGCAEEFRVTGRVLLQLSALGFVTGEAGPCDVGAQLHVERCVGVGVAGTASAYLVMLLP
ncbi:MAG: hypothetical protein ACOYVJ_02240 [Nitrospirota bacterium]